MGQFLTMHTVGALMVGGGSAGGVLLMACHAARHARRERVAWAEVDRLERLLAEGQRDPVGGAS